MKKGVHKSKKVCYDNPRWEIGVIFGPVAQLGAQRVRFSATSIISYCFILLFRFWNC